MGLGWLVCSSRAGTTGLRLCKPPLKTSRAQAVTALSGMAGHRSSQLCFLLPASFPRPGNGFCLGVTLPSLSPSSGPCLVPQRCCSPSPGAPVLGWRSPETTEHTSPRAALFPATLSLKPARLFQKYLCQQGNPGCLVKEADPQATRE